MKSLLAVLAVAAACFAAGRLSISPPADALECSPDESAVECCSEVTVAGDVNGDERCDISDAVHLLDFLFVGGSHPECSPILERRVTELEGELADAWAEIEATQAELGQCQTRACLPDTGQTTCYNEDGIVIPCDSATCPGQDGFYETGCPPEGRFIDNGDGTVTDTCTGLMWQKDTAPGTYTWREALEYCENLTLADHDDWRLPNVRELQSVVDYGRRGPSIDPVFGASWSHYWSSTPGAVDTDVAWHVGFIAGELGGVFRDGRDHVRAVRTIQPGE